MVLWRIDFTISHLTEYLRNDMGRGLIQDVIMKKTYNIIFIFFNCITFFRYWNWGYMYNCPF